MITNKYLEYDAPKKGDLYITNRKGDAVIDFNTILLEASKETGVPLLEKNNFLYIVFKNIMEEASKKFNTCKTSFLHTIIFLTMMFQGEIYEISKTIPYESLKNKNFRMDDLQMYPMSANLADMLNVLLMDGFPRFVSYKSDDLKNRWFDGIDYVPISLFRDYSYTFLQNNLDLWCLDYIESEVQKMYSRHIKLVIAWVDKDTKTDDLERIRSILRVEGYFALFQNIDVLNASFYRPSEDEEDLKYPKLVQKYAEYDYFEKEEFNRYIRVPDESFQEVIDFYDQAALNPDVRNIFISLYRGTPNGKLIDALITATRNQKQVFVYVEMLARGNEDTNLQIVKQLLKEANQAYLRIRMSYLGMKVHAKMGLVIMNDGRMIVHMATGNFNEATTKVYTDYHTIGTNADAIRTAVDGFSAIEGRYPMQQKIKEKILKAIRTEAFNGPAGRICLKCNHFLDDDIVRELRMASSCGARVKLIVRTSLITDCQEIGAEITTVVGQFLEHERIYMFGSGDDITVYMSSSDLLFRNLYKRMEGMFEVLDPELCRELAFKMWGD